MEARKQKETPLMKLILDELYNSKVHDSVSLSEIFENYMNAYPKEEGYVIEFLVSDTFYRVKIYETDTNISK